MAHAQDHTMLAKIVGGVVALAAAWAAQKAVSGVWKAASGHHPPQAEDGDGANLGEIAAAAAITGALVALSRVLATQGTARLAARVDANS